MFGTLDVKSRPLKLAYLVDPNNTKQTKDAIQLSSSLWGGIYFPIIPLHKRMPATWKEKPLQAPSAENVIKGYIEAYDPDILVQLSKCIPNYINDLGLKIIKPDSIWNSSEEGGNYVTGFGIGIFEILENFYEEYFKYKMKYPVEVIFPVIPKQYSLFWTSFFGEISVKIAHELERNYFEPLEIKTPTVEIEDINNLVARKKLYPTRIVRHEINVYNRSSFGRSAIVFFMDATKTEDIIDYWNLRALGKKIIPVPKQFRENVHFNGLIRDFVKKHFLSLDRNSKVFDPPIVLKARNCTKEETELYAKNIIGEQEAGGDPHQRNYVLQPWYPRVWDEWARDKDSAVPSDIYGTDETSIDVADKKELIIKFRSILPKFAQTSIYSGKPRCVNEISFRFYGADEYIAGVFPKLSGENYVQSISGLYSFHGDWRIGRNGLAKLVKDAHNETIEIPSSEKVFFAWLEDLGFKPQLSSSGLLAKQIHKKLNGYLRMLSNEKVLNLLEYMNGGSTNENGILLENNKIHQERELPVGEVKKKLGGSTRNNNLHDYLIEKGIFKIGLQVQCPQCSRNSWFALENVRDVLSCPKCLNGFSAIGNIDKAKWSYKTAGPFSVHGHAEGAYTVLLTLDFFNEAKMHAFIGITPALSFTAESANKKIEADLGAFWKESSFGEIKEGVFFGECKTYNLFQKKDFDRMRFLAKTFPGAILVFSTLRKSLETKEISSLKRIAKAGRKHWKAERTINPVLILTGKELFSRDGPPYCWEESIQHKYRNTRGILDICDATQQIYLNLPSLETEWHEKLQKKRQLKKAKEE